MPTQRHSQSTSQLPTEVAHSRLASQENWLAWASQSKKASTSLVLEFPIYTDSHIVGQSTDGIGPYGFLNTTTMHSGLGQVNVAIVLRVDYCCVYQYPDMSTTNESLYYGGETIADEIAALISLALGIRTQAGDISREFRLPHDPFGQPREGLGTGAPTLMLTRDKPLLPALAKSCSLNDLSILETIPTIEPDRYVNLIRAARAYQSALWIADADPNLCWLLLVAAIETAANDEIKESGTPDVLLSNAKPFLAAYLKEFDDTNLLLKIGEEFGPVLRSTKKFVDFGLDFLPPAPSTRPPHESAQVEWTRRSIKMVLEKVYEYRSRFLHRGLPFPDPMLRSIEYGLTNPPPEIPSLALATHSRGATWKPKDLPINLHCFHYLAQGLLVNWWRRSLAKQD